MEGLQDVALGRHHALELDCDWLVGGAFGDPQAFAARWREIDAELREHMAAEDELLLPAYRVAEPEEADALRAEHAQIRQLLDDIAPHVSRGIHAERLRRLAAALHAHAAREDTTLYTWADRNLPELAWQRVRARIGRRR